MNNETRTTIACQLTSYILFTAVFLIIFALPVHLLMIKILYKDCQLVLPRHKIMMSLTISDALHISTMSLTMIFRKIISESSQIETECKYIQLMVALCASITLIVSSLNIVSLSIERYIACVHSLYVYHILTTRRVVSALCLQWVFGVIIGIITTYLLQVDNSGKEPVIFQRTVVMTVFPSATVIMAIQLRLLHFSRSKLATVKPDGAFGNQAEMADFRKKQVKVTFVASIVAIAYITCMFPLSILYAWEWHHGILHPKGWRSFLVPLAMLNTLFDPLIYGIGIGETRKMAWKNISQAKELLIWHIFNGSSSQST